MVAQDVDGGGLTSDQARTLRELATALADVIGRDAQ
jgi:hypothetical protein